MNQINQQMEISKWRLVEDRALAVTSRQMRFWLVFGNVAVLAGGLRNAAQGRAAAPAGR